MKRTFLLLFIFIFIFTFTATCNALAQNGLYKSEINSVIKKQIPYSKKQIRSVINEIKNEDNIYVKNVLVEQGINSIILEFYIKLANVTNKYFDIDENIPSSDWYEDVRNLIMPYLEDNKVDISKINSFLEYANKKQRLIEKKYGY